MGGHEAFITSILVNTFQSCKQLARLACLMCLTQAKHLLDKTFPVLTLPPSPSPSPFFVSRHVLMIFPFGNINGFRFLALGQFLLKVFLQKGRFSVTLELSSFDHSASETFR